MSGGICLDSFREGEWFGDTDDESSPSVGILLRPSMGWDIYGFAWTSIERDCLIYGPCMSLSSFVFRVDSRILPRKLETFWMILLARTYAQVRGA